MFASWKALTLRAGIAEEIAGPTSEGPEASEPGGALYQAKARRVVLPARGVATEVD